MLALVISSIFKTFSSTDFRSLTTGFFFFFFFNYFLVIVTTVEGLISLYDGVCDSMYRAGYLMGLKHIGVSLPSVETTVEVHGGVFNMS